LASTTAGAAAATVAAAATALAALGAFSLTATAAGLATVLAMAVADDSDLETLAMMRRCGWLLVIHSYNNIYLSVLTH
jgi:hypothetical protein